MACLRTSSGEYGDTCSIRERLLADIEGRVRPTEGQGDRHTFLAVLENFS